MEIIVSSEEMKKTLGNLIRGADMNEWLCCGNTMRNYYHDAENQTLVEIQGTQIIRISGTHRGEDFQYYKNRKTGEWVFCDEEELSNF